MGKSIVQRQPVPDLGMVARKAKIVGFKDTEDAATVYAVVIVVGDQPQGFLTDLSNHPITSLSLSFLGAYCQQQGIPPYEERIAGVTT